MMRDVNKHPAYLNVTWNDEYMNELKKFKDEVQF